MTDRELLEMAAKAVGYAALPVEGWTVDSAKGMRFVGPDNEFVRYWNPLTDDGDALRLAVALNFGVTVDDPDVSVTSQAGKVVYQKSAPDPYAATRRTIVRAAAEIGKAMP